MKILTIGDSHSKYLALNQEVKENNSIFKGVDSQVLRLDGATINGFGKRESTLNSQERLINRYNDFKPDFLCFALGQVDIELGYYYRLVVKNERIDFDEFVNELVDNYISSVDKVSEYLEHSKSSIVFKGCNVPVLIKSQQKAIQYTYRIVTENVKNETEREKYKHLLSNILPTSLQRNRRHLLFNKILSERCKEKGYGYFDVNDCFTSGKFGLIRDEFIPSGFDHHIVDSLYVREKHLLSLLDLVC